MAAVPETAFAALPGQLPRHPLLFASLVTAVAGYVDAVGFVMFDRLYVSFMSGNSTRLGVALASRNWADAVAAGAIIAAFVGGSFAGTRVALAGPRRAFASILLCEIGLLCASALLAAQDMLQAAMALVAFAMGMQNLLRLAIHGTGLGKGYVTGLLFDLGAALARAAHDRAMRSHAALNLLSWLSLLAGIVSGSLALSVIGLPHALVLAALALGTLLALDVRKAPAR